MKAIIIGRDKEQCDYIVSDAFVSRSHVQIVEHDDKTYTVFDLESSTGTFVNGNRILKETKIERYDIIKIGNTVLNWNEYFDKPTNESKEQELPKQPIVNKQSKVNESEAPIVNEIKYAGFGLRLVALIIDIIFSWIMVIPVVIFTVEARMSMEEQDGLNQMAMVVIAWLYYAISESSTWQATLGKKIVGIHVESIDGNRISFANATGRHFGKIISSIILFIGYFMALWTDKKQTLHDQMANCVVVKNK